MTVWIVEDDEGIRELTAYALRASGYEARGFEDGEAYLAALRGEGAPPEMTLLDVMLPGEDGLAILKRLRSDSRTAKSPVILLTAKGGEYDKVVGLNAGADDYVAKPFGVTELIARIRAVLRRTESGGDVCGALRCAGIEIDEGRRAVFAGGAPVELTYKEYELLAYMIRNAELVLSRDRIMDAVWGIDFRGESRTVDMHVKTLRKKLGPPGRAIQTIRNVGYKIGDVAR